MKLTLSKREKQKKSELTSIRHRGDIPAIIYRREKKGERYCSVAGDTVTVPGTSFYSALRHIKKGYLPTHIFELDIDGVSEKAVVKGVEYHPTTYQILHLDFFPLREDQEIDVRVPLDCLRVADCVGIKLGGFLRYLQRHIQVRCFPSEIPTDFKIDIAAMEIGDVKRVKDLHLGDGVRPLSSLNEIVIAIAKR